MSQEKFKLLSESTKAFGEDLDSLFASIHTIERSLKTKSNLYLLTEIYSPKAILNWTLNIKIFKKE